MTVMTFIGGGLIAAAVTILGSDLPELARVAIILPSCILWGVVCAGFAS